MSHCPRCGTVTDVGDPSCPFCTQPLPVAVLPVWRRNGTLELAAVAVLFALFAILWIVIFAADKYR